MRRRELMLLLGGAAASWTLAARAQQKARPVVGYLGSASPNMDASFGAAFLRGG